jgi:hypothetical protein
MPPGLDTFLRGFRARTARFFRWRIGAERTALNAATSDSSTIESINVRLVMARTPASDRLCLVRLGASGAAGNLLGLP